jgi:hypothetical protein
MERIGMKWKKIGIEPEYGKKWYEENPGDDAL